MKRVDVDKRIQVRSLFRERDVDPVVSQSLWNHVYETLLSYHSFTLQNLKRPISLCACLLLKGQS